MQRSRKKIIIIHGWGSSFHQAIDQLTELFDFNIYWHQGTFYFSNRDNLLIRKLLNTPFENRLITSCQKLLVAKMLLASTSPSESSIEGYSEYSEDALIRDFGHFGIPFSFYEREYRGNTLKKRALKELKKPLEALATMKQEITLNNGKKLTEDEIRKKYENKTDYSDVIELVEEIRNMQETGGDLDTVASATFYTYWLIEKSNSENVSMIYGKDYDYAFVNYHEGLRNLVTFGPADILMADFPSGAIPELEADVRYLAEHDIIIERYEDHHPYTKEHLSAFQNLQNDGLVSFFSLSGPGENERELSEEELKCGADMVYENIIQGTAFDSEGCVELKRAAHSEDFVSDRYRNGMKLTEIIKGDICKIEIIQTLLKSLYDNKMMKHLEKQGWLETVLEWNEYYRSIEDKLLENVYMVHCKRPGEKSALSGGASLGAGSDVAIPVKETDKDTPDTPLKLIFALATFTEKGMPKFYIGKATEYYTRKFPGADYLFYCYGSNILIGRRLNQADFSLNLGELMPSIGETGDGGHAGAAVGRPSKNRDYPVNLLGRVNGRNFRRYVEYMGHRLSDLGYKTCEIKDLSQNVELFSRKKGIALLIMLVAAFLIGLSYLLFDSSYRIDRIIESNKRFYPQLKIEE